MHAFDYGLVLRALEKHVRMAQNAADFARQNQKGSLYAQAMLVLVEAERALTHVKQQREAAYARSNPPLTVAPAAPAAPSSGRG